MSLATEWGTFLSFLRPIKLTVKLFLYTRNITCNHETKSDFSLSLHWCFNIRKIYLFFIKTHDRIKRKYYSNAGLKLYEVKVEQHHKALGFVTQALFSGLFDRLIYSAI